MKIAIIGAGVTGLSAAWDVVREGHDVTVFEASDTLGGLAGGFKEPHWDSYLEKYYHHWFTSDRHLLALADEIGVAHKIQFLRPKTSYWMDGKIVRSEMNASIFSLPISLMSIFRMASVGVFLKFLVRDGNFLEKYTAHEWMLTYMGEEAYTRFFLPLLIGKFGERYQEINMAWMWARIFTRSVKLGTYVGGFQAFVDDLAHAVQQRGATLLLNSPVERLELSPNGQPLLRVNGNTLPFDRVISTTSPELLLRMTPALHETRYGDVVRGLESIGAVVVVVSLKHPLLEDGTYWLNLPATDTDKTTSEFPFLALVEHTNYVDKSAFGGEHLLYLGDYVASDHAYFQMSEDALRDLFVAQLARFNPCFSPEWINKTWVFRAPYAQPLAQVGQSERLPALETPMPGVYWASMSQVYPYDRGTNYAVELGRRVARLMLQEG